MTVEELVGQHYAEIEGHFRRYGPDGADLTQETFARVAAAIRERPVRNPAALTRRIAWIVRADYLRAKARDEEGPAGSPRTLPWGTPWQLQFADEFDSALRALPENERDAFILMELRGLPLDEAAAVLEAPRSTVHARHTRALERLRKELQ